MASDMSNRTRRIAGRPADRSRPPHPRSAASWWCMRRPARGRRCGDRGPGGVPRRHAGAAAGLRDGRDHRRPTAAAWRKPAWRCSPPPSRRCVGSCIWCRTAAIAPPRANCRRVRCCPSHRTATRSRHVRRACGGQAASPRCRTRRWRCCAPTASRWCRAARSRRAEDAAAAARLLGFPAVVKLRQAVPPGRAAAGGLALDLHDAAEVTVAARLLAARHARRAPAKGDGRLLVQRQAARRANCRIRVARRCDVRADDQLRPGRHDRGHRAATSLPICRR